MAKFYSTVKWVRHCARPCPVSDDRPSLVPGSANFHAGWQWCYCCPVWLQWYLFWHSSGKAVGKLEVWPIDLCYAKAQKRFRSWAALHLCGSRGAPLQRRQLLARAYLPPSLGCIVLGQTLLGCAYLPHSTVHPSYKHTHVHMVLIMQVCALAPVESLNASLVVTEGVKVQTVVKLGNTHAMQNKTLQSTVDLASVVIKDISVLLWKCNSVLRNRILLSPCQCVFWYMAQEWDSSCFHRNEMLTLYWLGAEEQDEWSAAGAE